MAALYSPGSSFEGSRSSVHVWLPFVHQFEGLADEGTCVIQGSSWWHPIGMGCHNVGDGSTVLEMVAQGWGWPHRFGGDGEDVLRSPCVTTLSWASFGSVDVRSSRVSSSLFEGCGVEEGRERVAQCQGMTYATPHSARTTPVKTAQWRAVRTVPRPDSQAVSRDRRGGDFPFDLGVCGMSRYLMLRLGE
jgi:hypothetical protein